ncbi:MAG: tRNA threonylcarbamoyladenosine dehydratase [Syntrophomonadaceae bacterium]|nr:tRNA threonylcarbamoyladenosine dehydratase [Syntrophomonadaceae bacterium]
MRQEFSRTELLIGKEGLAKLSRSKVAVFGIGGVGSYAVEGLVRCGVGSLVLVDDDCISPSNINRQLHANVKTVGKPKVAVMKERILDINPQAKVIVHQKFYMPEFTNELILPNYDYIIDAIDTVTAKIDLIVNARQKNIPIISCMGAGNKLDPVKLEIADLYSTSVCPLAKVMRRELRKRGIDNLKVVYSREEPVKSLQNLEHEEPFSENVSVCLHASKRIPSNHRSILGSIAFVPSVAGMLLAGEVVKDLIGYQTPQ